MTILVLDNYDSFTYNLVHCLRKTGATVDVLRNDKLEPEDAEPYDKILLSPGPGIPAEAGRLLEMIRYYAGRKSILGVCLGQQAIGEAFGGRLKNLDTVFHGLATPVRVIREDSLFAGLPETFVAGRYHSWVVDEVDFPADLEITATDETGLVMALRHRTYDLRGVQFHPESVLTPQGEQILQNWVRS